MLSIIFCLGLPFLLVITTWNPGAIRRRVDPGITLTLTLTSSGACSVPRPG